MKIRTRGNKNADETTDIVFTIKSQTSAIVRLWQD